MARAGRRGNKWLTLAVVALGVLLAMADTTIVNLALPSIREDLGFLDVSITELEWVVNAYVLAFAALLLTAGRLADLFGRRLIFLVGLVVFIGASIACGAADDIDALILFRGLQGVGAALLAPTSLSIVTSAFPERERGLAIGVWSAVVGLGVALGPLVGGVLTEHVDWRWVFYINIPVGIVSFVGAIAWIRESRDAAIRPNLDLPGAALSSLGLFALTFGLLKGNDFGWLDVRTLLTFAVAVIALIAFVRVERAQDDPMLDLSLFRSATFSGANATAVLVGFALLGFVFFFSLFIQNVLGYSPTKAGASLLPLMIILIVLAPVVGKLSDRFGPKWLLAEGMLLLGIGLLWLSTIDADTTFWDYLPGMCIGGVGFALVLTPLTAAGLAGVPPENAGVGAAVINATRQVGGSLGIAILGAISTARIEASLLDGKSSLDGFVDAFGLVILVAAGVAFVGAVVAAATVSNAPSRVRAATTSAWAVPIEVREAAAVERALRAERTERAAPEQAEPEPEPAFLPRGVLLVVEGPASGVRLPFGFAPFVIGRDGTGLAALGDDPQLSRRHASVSALDDDEFLVEDLGSANGTWVNAMRIVSPTVARAGDTIRVGQNTLEIVPADRGE